MSTTLARRFQMYSVYVSVQLAGYIYMPTKYCCCVGEEVCIIWSGWRYRHILGTGKLSSYLIKLLLIQVHTLGKACWRCHLTFFALVKCILHIASSFV